MAVGIGGNCRARGRGPGRAQRCRRTTDRAGCCRAERLAATARGGQTAPPRIDADAAIRQLAQAIRGVAQEQQQITTRMAAVERNLDDMTGSITRQIDAVKPAPATVAWPDPNTSSPEAIAAAMAPPSLPLPPNLLAAPNLPAPSSVPAPVATTTTSPAPEPVATQAATPAAVASAGAYGADIGGASSIKTLHAAGPCCKRRIRNCLKVCGRA